MSENRTEKPTNRHLKKAKERGEVAKSPFFAGALLFFGGTFIIRSFFSGAFQESLRVGLSHLQLEGAFYRIINPLLFPLLLTFSGLILIACGAHLFQTGWLWSFRKQKGKGARPIVVPLTMLGLIGVILYLNVQTTKIDPNFLFHSSEKQYNYFLKKIFCLALELGVTLLLIGFSDFLYQKWRFYKKMHMTPEEKQEELRESEGNPQMKKYSSASKRH